jgi:hypothetical protein
MTATELLRRLLDMGAKLEPVEGRLRVAAPVGVLTPEIRAELVANKPVILSILAGRDGPDPPARRKRRSWRDLPNMSTGPRDVRQGRRWYDFHWCSACGRPKAVRTTVSGAVQLACEGPGCPLASPPRREPAPPGGPSPPRGDGPSRHRGDGA